MLKVRDPSSSLFASKVTTQKLLKNRTKYYKAMAGLWFYRESERLARGEKRCLIFTVREIPGGKAVLGGFTLSVWYICLITVERQGSLTTLPHHHEDYHQSPWTGAASKVLLLGDSPKCLRGRAFWEVLRSLADDFGRGCRRPVSSPAPFLGDDVSFLFTRSLLSHQRPNQ